MSVARKLLRDKEAKGELVPYIREGGFVVYTTPIEMEKRDGGVPVMTSDVFKDIASSVTSKPVITEKMEVALHAAGSPDKPGKLARQRRELGERKERKDERPQVVVEPLEGQKEEDSEPAVAKKKPAKKEAKPKKEAAKKKPAKKEAKQKLSQRKKLLRRNQLRKKLSQRKKLLRRNQLRKKLSQRRQLLRRNQLRNNLNNLTSGLLEQSCPLSSSYFMISLKKNSDGSAPLRFGANEHYLFTEIQII